MVTSRKSRTYTVDAPESHDQFRVTITPRRHANGLLDVIHNGNGSRYQCDIQVSDGAYTYISTHPLEVPAGMAEPLSMSNARTAVAFFICAQEEGNLAEQGWIKLIRK